MTDQTQLWQLIEGMIARHGNLPSVLELRAEARCATWKASQALKNFRQHHPDITGSLVTQKAPRTESPKGRSGNRSPSNVSTAEHQGPDDGLERLLNRIDAAIESLIRYRIATDPGKAVFSARLAEWMISRISLAAETHLSRREINLANTRLQKAIEDESAARTLLHECNSDRIHGTEAPSTKNDSPRSKTRNREIVIASSPAQDGYQNTPNARMDSFDTTSRIVAKQAELLFDEDLVVGAEQVAGLETQITPPPGQEAR